MTTILNLFPLMKYLNFEVNLIPAVGVRLGQLHSLRMTLRNFLVILALFDVWGGWGLGGAAASLPGFAVKTVRLGCGVAAPPWLDPYLKHLDISLCTWQYVDMASRFLYWFLLFFFHLICFSPCTFFVFVFHPFHIVPLLYVTWLRINDIYNASVGVAAALH